MELGLVITGLLRKRQAIADESELAQGTVRKLIQDIDAIDATIKLFQPDAPIGIVRVRPTLRRHAATRGESGRLILNMLREADGPMMTRDIVLKVMEARGLNAADRVMHETKRLRVSSSLRGLRDRGSLKSGDGKGSGVLWTITTNEDAPITSA